MHGDHQYYLCAYFSINGDAFLSANCSFKANKSILQISTVILSLQFRSKYYNKILLYLQCSL